MHHRQRRVDDVRPEDLVRRREGGGLRRVVRPAGPLGRGGPGGRVRGGQAAEAPRE